MSHLYILLYSSWLSLKQNFVAEVLLERNLRSILVEEPLIWYIWSFKVRIHIWSESRLYCFPDLKSCKPSQIDVILGELWRGSTKEAFSLKPVRAGKGWVMERNCNRIWTDLRRMDCLISINCWIWPVGSMKGKLVGIRGKFRDFLRKGRTTVEHNRNRCKGALLRGSTQYSLEASPDPIYSL